MMLSAVKNYFINIGRTFNQPYDSNNIQFPTHMWRRRCPNGLPTR